MALVYYAEDDNSIRELVIYALQSASIQAEGFSAGDAMISAVNEKIPDAILLDIMLPGVSGIEILKKLKSNAMTRKIPVMMLTAKDSEYDKVQGLDLGADDYLAKPFGMMEMTARVKALLRRSADDKDKDILVYENVTLDPEKHIVTVREKNVDLSLKEYETLRYLMKNAGRVITRDILMENIWGYDFDAENRTVDVHIRTLRKKLGRYGDIIDTVRGVGYRIGK